MRRFKLYGGAEPSDVVIPHNKCKENKEKNMRNCLWRCLRDFLPWFVSGSVISAIVAYFMGITIVIVIFPPGIIAALAALVGVFILLYIVGITICVKKCKGQ